MRPGGERILRLLKFDPANDLPAGQIKFRHLRSIPQTAPGATPATGCDDAIGERRRDHIARAQVEGLESLSSGGVEQDRIVGEVVGAQEFVVASMSDNA